MTAPIRALRPALVKGVLTCWNMHTDKNAPLTKPNDILLARVLCEIEAATGQMAYMEYWFHPTRKYRFDGAFPVAKVAVEIEGLPGGPSGKSRHTTWGGFQGDIVKYRAAEDLGWRVLRFTWREVRDGTAQKSITKVLKGGSDGQG